MLLKNNVVCVGNKKRQFYQGCVFVKGKEVTHWNMTGFNKLSYIRVWRTGKKFWNRYRTYLVLEKVSEPVSEKFDTGTDFRRQYLGILKIYNGYRYRVGTGTENFSFFWWYRNRYRKKLVPEKSLGTGIGKIRYRKKVSEPVSGKFSTVKSTGIGIEKI